MALPHGASMKMTCDLAEKGLKVVDLSADYRYDNIDIYEKVYGIKHEYPEWNKKAVYGIPELYREKIKEAPVVANPGCYPTCSILGFAPLLCEKRIDPKSIIIDAASGVSVPEEKANCPIPSANARRIFWHISRLPTVIPRKSQSSFPSFTESRLN